MKPGNRICSIVGFMLVLVLAGACQTVNISKTPPQYTLADQGKTDYVISLARDAAPAERHAADELARFLKEVTGAEFAIAAPEERGERPAIAVGPGATLALMPKLDLTGLGADGIVIRNDGANLILTGGPGAPRGTLYAVYTFLEDSVGCHWWAPGVSDIPHRTTLAIPELRQRYDPPFEYRDMWSMESKDLDWLVRNKVNGTSGGAVLDAAHGGGITYRGGFVHTLNNNIVPSAEYFPKHPEWFAEIGGKREGGKQYCLTNPDLLAFCIQWVRTNLRDAPPGAIVSVSQNDGGAEGRCQCPACLAIEGEEGSPSGPLLRFVNAIADAIKDDFPHAAIDTLAYQYTRKPPRQTQPRPNVIIRLCPIECSYAQPLDADVNRAFAEDLRGWASICRRIYIWDYITDLDQFMLPYPDLRVRGPNTRFYARHGVKGIFEQGSGPNRAGVALSELHFWLMTKLLWNPAADDQALIHKFLDGYYRAAAPSIAAYIRLLHDTNEKTGYFLRCGAPVNAPYLTVDLLQKSEQLFQDAETAVMDSPDVLKRVRLAHASIQYAVLAAWPTLKQEARAKGIPWPFGSAHELLNRFVEICHANQVVWLSDAMSVNDAQSRFELVTGPRTEIAPPEMCKNLPAGDWVEFQEDACSLSGGPAYAEIRPDPAAANGKAVWLSSKNVGWSCNLSLPVGLWMEDMNQQWRVFVVARVEKKGKGEGVAFRSGIYDPDQKKSIGECAVALADVKDAAYHAYEVGKTGGLSYSRWLWIEPILNPENVENLWIDRIFMIKTPGDKP